MIRAKFGIELVVARNYALALVLITPLVLVLTGAVTLFRMPRFLKRLAADLDNHPAREANRD